MIPRPPAASGPRPAWLTDQIAGALARSLGPAGRRAFRHQPAGDLPGHSIPKMSIPPAWRRQAWRADRAANDRHRAALLRRHELDRDLLARRIDRLQWWCLSNETPELREVTTPLSLQLARRERALQRAIDTVRGWRASDSKGP
jgi:hypothetical protein